MSNEDLQHKISQLFQEDGEKVLVCLKVSDGTQKQLNIPSPKKKFYHGASFMDISSKTKSNAVLTPTAATPSSINSKVQINSPAPSSNISKKKTRVVALTMKPNGKVRFHKIKLSGSNSTVSIGKTWPLEDIKVVENLSESEFSVTLNKQYVWMVEESNIKVEFLYILLKLCLKLKKPPKLINLSEDALKDELETYKRRVKVIDEDGLSVDEDGEGAATSNNKTLDETYLQVQFDQDNLRIDEVLMDYNWKAGGDADAIESRLLNELAALEAANLHAIIQADQQSANIVALIDKALQELDSMDEWLGLYHSELLNTGKDIQHIENQNKGLQVQTQNQKALKQEMDALIAALTVSDGIIETLKNEPFDSLSSIEAIEKAAFGIQKSLHVKLEDPLNDLTAVKERMQWMGQQSSQFSQRLLSHISSLVNQESSYFRDQKRTFPGTDIVISSCADSLHGLLFPMRNLLEWMKEVDARKLTELQMTYVQQINQLYRASFKDVFDQLRNRCPKRLAEDPNYLFALTSKGFFGGGSMLTPIGSAVKSTSMASLMSKTHKRGTSGDGGDLSKMKPLSGGGRIGESQMSLDLASPSPAEEKVNPVEALDRFFQAFMPLTIQEYNFLIDFFQFPGSLPSGFTVDDLLEQSHCVKPVQKDLKTKKKLDELMETLFDGIIPEILAWFEVALKPDVSTVVGFLVVLERFKTKTSLIKPGNDSVVISQSVPYLSIVITSLQERLNTIYERFIEEQLKAIEDTKLTVKSRSGILSFIRIFPKFVTRLESFCKDLPEFFEIRKSVNSCYNRGIQLIFSNLETIASEFDKDVAADDREQLNAHILTIENMHHLHSELRSLKIPCLESHVKHSKQQYESHLNSYIKAVVRKPLGKLLSFFEGMEELLKSKQPDEIPYHLNFNKSAIKKCIISFPGKEIKKSLETLYKRVDKHFCEEEGLLRVVWHGIQEEFIRFHQHVEMLIQKCYPESDIHLLFTVQDLCVYFSDIAKNV